MPDVYVNGKNLRQETDYLFALMYPDGNLDEEGVRNAGCLLSNALQWVAGRNMTEAQWRSILSEVQNTNGEKGIRVKF